jgi:WhiB family transcriptional regulator, redox-sensing transcriptional regulator
VNGENWKAHGRCAETDPELWFPDKGHAPRAARRICFACPVQEQCLAYALDRPELLGVWGGYTEPERRLMRRGQEAA